MKLSDLQSLLSTFINKALAELEPDLGHPYDMQFAEWVVEMFNGQQIFPKAFGHEINFDPLSSPVYGFGVKVETDKGTFANAIQLGPFLLAVKEIIPFILKESEFTRQYHAKKLARLNRQRVNHGLAPMKVIEL